MIDDNEAIARILGSTVCSGNQEVDLLNARGRYLLDDVRAVLAFPGFDQSVMDGYALCAEDQQKYGEKLRISGVNAAGSGKPGALGTGEAMRIYTGAPLPAGADSVVMQEDVEVEGNTLVIKEKVRPGDYIRRRGEVVCAGQMIAESGQKLNPANLGLIASQGIDRISVASWPRVVLITTGDELVPIVSKELKFGQVFNSNSAMLEASLRHLGVPDVEICHVGDELQSTLDAIRSAIQRADVVLISGGLSVGDRDYVKPCLEQCGVEVQFWRVRVKPGKPFLYAAFGEGGQLFGLPGNPVSALITFLIFVLPSLQLRLGASPDRVGLPSLQARSLDPIHNTGNRPHYVMGIYDHQGGFRAMPGQFSQNILALGQANALARIDAHCSIQGGETLDVRILWGE
ncbi:MAG: gephyrin-like molybdotransferase Glp [Verrucomicrobiota bacterium]|nr:gephyrin-like molybdotransferase Glp [Verrucomicrobiota bacterium]